MLEVGKILQDIDNLGRERAELVKGLGQEFDVANDQIGLMSADLEAVKSKIRAARTSWLVAEFDQRPNETYPLPSLPPSYAVAAVDGSQIMTDKHEVALCYLLNTAAITLYYGCDRRPERRNTPVLCYKDEDLFMKFDKRQVRVTDRHVGNRRTLAEAAELENAAQIANKTGVPVVALSDGSLIRWEIEGEPADYKSRVLSEYLRLFETTRDLGVPVAGYISDPGARDFVNAIKVNLCDQSPVDCDRCKWEDTPEKKPCNAVGSLTDALVWEHRLKNGSRSVMFKSQSKILGSYGEHHVYAFYMDSGSEIARVEVPEWVARDRNMADLVHAVCRDQADKGRGYPVALSEAHEHAVVQSRDRALFFELIERSLLKHGVRIGYSQKRISKNY